MLLRKAGLSSLQSLMFILFHLHGTHNAKLNSTTGGFFTLLAMLRKGYFDQ